MENGALEDAAFLEAVFNDEALGSLDVFKVYAAKGGGHEFDHLNDLLRVLGIDANGEGVHIAEGLEKQGFAFHNRHGRSGADVAQAQHGRTVGNHADEVGVIGIDIQHLRVFVDFHAGFGNAGRVGQRQVVIIAHGHFDPHFDFPRVILVHGQGFFTQIFDPRHLFSFWWSRNIQRSGVSGGPG